MVLHVHASLQSKPHHPVPPPAPRNPLSERSMWFRDVSRQEAELVLQSREEGTFLIRPAGGNKLHMYTLDMK